MVIFLKGTDLGSGLGLQAKGAGGGSQVESRSSAGSKYPIAKANFKYYSLFRYYSLPPMPRKAEVHEYDGYPCSAKILVQQVVVAIQIKHFLLLKRLIYCSFSIAIKEQQHCFEQKISKEFSRCFHRYRSH